MGLINRGFNIKDKTSKGPDICFDFENERYFIEATAISYGNENRPDSVPHPTFDSSIQVHSYPKEQMQLRYISAITAKKDIYNGYIQKDLVRENDYKLIAVSGCGIPIVARMGDTVTVPIIVKCLMGIGDQVILLNKETLNPEDSGNGILCARVDFIQKSNGNKVNNKLFFDSSFDNISAVLYSHSNISDSPDNPADDFILCINPNAKKVLPNSFLTKLQCHKYNFTNPAGEGTYIRVQ